MRRLRGTPGPAPIRRFLLVFSIVGLVWPAASTSAASAVRLETMPIPDTPLVIDVPVDWWPGGARGYGVLVSLIGRGEGFPNFAIMTDPTHESGSDRSRAEIQADIEALFDEVTSGKKEAEVLEAGWRVINDIRVHVSTSTWDTVTGRLKARRLIFAQGGRPYILTWLERDDRYAEIEGLIERCVDSLRPQRAGAAVGAGD